MYHILAVVYPLFFISLGKMTCMDQEPFTQEVNNVLAFPAGKTGNAVEKQLYVNECPLIMNPTIVTCKLALSASGPGGFIRTS